MSVQCLELKPNRSLLDPNFESYKLSLDALPCFQTRLSSPVGPIRSCSENQYSYLHAKLFGQTNLLVQDPFNPDSAFLLDGLSGQICQILFAPDGVSVAPELLPVWTLPSGLPSGSQAGDYNPSLVFAGESLAVFADGTGVIFILETGVRASGSPQQWKTIFHDEICGKNRPFVVSSACLITTTGDAEKVLHCLLNYVEDKSTVEGLKIDKTPANVNFVNVVEWMTFAAGAECWGLDRVRRFAFFGGTDYLQLDKSASHLICTTEKPFQLVFDSTGTMEIDEDDKVTQKDPERPPPPFFWFQGVEDIVVWVSLAEDVTKRDIKVSLKPREMIVTIRGEIIFGGELWNVLESDSMTWTIQSGKLEINFCKANKGMIWQRFLQDESKEGEEISNPAIIDELLAQTAAFLQETNEEPLPAYNAQELEDCDALPSDSFALFIIDATNNSMSKKVPLSGHQWLFNVTSSSPSALGLRHDVDALVWLPEISKEDISFNHIGTFSALGYVQASKAQRKFTLASPSLSYAVIVEASRRVFVYRQPSAVPSEFDVRNRKSGQRVKQVAKQQVVTLEGNEDILGVVAMNKTLLVLTMTTVFGFKVE